MKTLDEVIDTFEKACDLERRCEGCSGCLSHDYGCPNDGAESVPDALHYLKEYQKVDSNWSEKVISELHNIADANFLRAYREDKDELTALRAFWKEQHENAPLTWDEMKTMIGKPVWVEGCGYSHGFWLIIDYFSVGDEDFIALGGKQFWKSDMTDENNGDSWQAYRKERQNVQS